MFNEAPEMMEYVFKTIVSIGISVMIFILKDFKSSMKDLTDNLNKLTIVVTTLIEKDSNREETIIALKNEVDALEKRVNKSEKEILRLEFLRKNKE